jgi:hypothetical protein
LSQGYQLEVHPIDDILFRKTPVAQWWTHHAIYLKSANAPRFFYSKVTNAVRALVVYKYGGIYLDYDMLVLRSLHDLSDTIAFETDSIIGSAYYSFQKGHPFLLRILQLFPTVYNPNKWGVDGPLLTTTVYLEYVAKNLVVPYKPKQKYTRGYVRTIPPGKLKQTKHIVATSISVIIQQEKCFPLFMQI